MASGRQQELFRSGALHGASSPQPASPPLLREHLLNWQQHLADFQGPLFERNASELLQGSLFSADPCGSGEDPQTLAACFDPLAFEAQNLQFWRWPESPQQGPALYLVMDRPQQLRSPLLLYVGETGQADRRWKGEHDCKAYLAAYGEAMGRAGLETRCSIRFCCDVPARVRPRRALEQALIRRWQPPFNKETRQRWGTPFTSDPV
ncbi:GIY-YIG nuclease family protein [Synechococcus sp. CS-205]|uniref:GIY-YIG nuclease family protein n=1 Tax=Synechococcus sp. CS-205 TaxID=2847984 RepID=UPI00223AD3FE|nr:GIY-YIG nuclease family protein [Synechococcus sp. CS-205]MCT0249348.1 GIY-YIG nuclease family protein [Synechococcus sp. CS-205]